MPGMNKPTKKRRLYLKAGKFDDGSTPGWADVVGSGKLVVPDAADTNFIGHVTDLAGIGASAGTTDISVIDEEEQLQFAGAITKEQMTFSVLSHSHSTYPMVKALKLLSSVEIGVLSGSGASANGSYGEIIAFNGEIAGVSRTNLGADEYPRLAITVTRRDAVRAYDNPSAAS